MKETEMNPIICVQLQRVAVERVDTEANRGGG